MQKKHLKTLSYLFFVLIFGLNSYAQNSPKKLVQLRNVLTELEKTYDVKFSFADSDVDTVQIPPPASHSLEAIIKEINNTTGITINKLNDRYYTLTKATTVSICGFVFDNFEENTIPGATIEIYGTNLSGITKENGSFSFDNVPINAIIQIKHLGYKPTFLKEKEFINSVECN
ncbi:unnamed protein product, partial [Ectocarpus sp. 12 AP-2014]